MNLKKIEGTVLGMLLLFIDLLGISDILGDMTVLHYTYSFPSVLHKHSFLSVLHFFSRYLGSFLR